MLENAGLQFKATIYVLCIDHRTSTPMLKAEDGAYNSVKVATAQIERISSGAYYALVDVEKRKLKAMGNEEMSKNLWAWYEKELETVDFE
jgi:hypothetical protein